MDIAAEDWDMLFLAALDMLARVTAPNFPGGVDATDHPHVLHPLDPLHALQSREVAIRECLDALDHLRRSVPLRCTVVPASQASSPSI